MENNNHYKVLKFKAIGDESGKLIALENNKYVPFEIKRVYYIYDSLHHITRGKHAHCDLQQLCICVKGSCDFLLDNGKEKSIIRMSSPEDGLYIKNLIWREMFNFSSDCVLLVLASDYYKESDYIRDYKTFIDMIKRSDK